MKPNYGDIAGTQIPVRSSDPLAKLQPFIKMLLCSNFSNIVKIDAVSGHCSPTALHLNTINRLNKYISIVAGLPAEFEFEPYVEVFIKCCETLKLIQRSSSGPAIVTFIDPVKSAFAGNRDGYIFFEFVHQLKMACSAFTFRKRVSERKKEQIKRYGNYCQYIDALFAANDRLVVLRVDLSFTKGSSTCRDPWTAFKYLNQLIEDRRGNTVFEGMVGYIIKTEYGVDKGIHFHAVFMFNGSLRNGLSHVHLARQIGEYWRDHISENVSGYWNCNDNISDFQRLGICGLGVIHWSDMAARQNLLINVLSYFFKDSQSFQMKNGPKFRMLRKGITPRIPEVRPGRPRYTTLSLNGAGVSAGTDV